VQKFYILLAAAIFLSLYSFLGMLLLPLPGGSKAVKRIKSLKGSEKKQQYILKPLTQAIANFISMSPYKRKLMVEALEEAEIDMSPEEYMAQALVKALVTAAGIPAFILLGIPVASGGCAFLAVAVYFRERGKIEDRIKKFKEEIMRELPRFIRTFSNSLRTTNDKRKIFETYRKVAGKALRRHIDILISEFETLNNVEEALRRFDARINIPQLSSFIDGVIGESRGIDQNTFFAIMEENMKSLAMENIRREIQKRPGKFRAATWAVAACGMLMYVAPVIDTIVQGLDVMK